MQSPDCRRTTVRCVAIVLLLGLPARADPPVPDTSHQRRNAHRRVLHATIAATVGAVSIVSDTWLKSTLAPSQCRWCAPPAFDASVRNAIVWRDTGRADLLSSIDAYVLTPAVGLGLLIAADHDAGWARLLDDTIPVAETIAINQLLTQMIKYTVGRQRPYARFGDPSRTPTNDDNTSFISGHSSLGFSITAASGLICHWRHYWTEPYVWGAGIALSLSVEYLRMGADKHYLSDVVVGGAVGVATGLLVPRLMRENFQIVPTRNGVAVAGAF
jgi:membrane-associated phospholipid phosphatase